MQTIRGLILPFVLMISLSTWSQDFVSTVDMPVPDDGVAYTFDIEVSGLPAGINLAYGLERVCINFNHTYDQDIQISLMAPDGTIIDLSSDNGGGGQNYSNTCFTENAWLPVSSASPPYSGSVNPEGNLNEVNNGQDPNGIWTLIFYDTYWFVDSGFLYSWSLLFTTDVIDPEPDPFAFESSQLPLIYITTDANAGIPNEPGVGGMMQVIDNGEGNTNYVDDPFTYEGRIDIEARGQSTLGFPKQSYGLEMRDEFGNEMDTTLLGFPAEEDFILYAPYSEKSLLQNWLAMNIGRQMGGYHSRTRYCEVFLNGVYNGIYLLMEKIKKDDNRVDVATLNPDENSGDDLTGGYIWRLDWGNATGWYSEFPTPADAANFPYYQFVYPKPTEVSVEQQNYLQAYVDSFEYALADADFEYAGKRYDEYIDVLTFIDDFIINELSKNVDGYRLSSYFHKDKDSNGGLMKNGPFWDFNLSFGNADYCDGSDTDEWMYQVCGNSGPFWWPRFMEDTVYTNALYCRWNQLRENVLSEEFLHTEIDSMAILLDGSVGRNFTRWPVLGLYVWPNSSPYATSYSEAIAQLKTWISGRLEWLDEHITGNPVCIPNVINNAANIEHFESETFPPPCWSVSDADGDNSNWQGASPVSGFESAQCAFSYSLGELVPDNYIITPQLSPVSGEHLTFYVSAFESMHEHYQVLLSTTGNDPADFNVLLWDEEITGANWRYRAADLAAWWGQDIYIAFRHYASEGNLMLKLDEVRYPSFTHPEADCFIGITEVRNAVQVYPNPAHDVLYVQATDNITSVQLYDAAGRLVFRKYGRTSRIEIDVAQFEPGIYQLSVITQEGVQLSRVVIQ